MNSTIATLWLQALQAACRASPLAAGSYWIATHPTVVKWANTTSAKRRVSRLKSGVEIEVQIDDLNGRMIWLFGAAEARVVRVCRHLCKRLKANTFLDIGANHGGVGLNVHNSLRTNAKIVLVEPQPELASRLQKACDYARRQFGIDASIVPAAIHDSSCSVTMAITPGHSGVASIATPGEDPNHQLTVDAITLDELAHHTEAGRNSRAIMKIDVESSTPEVLTQALTQRSVIAIVTENSSDPRMKEALSRAVDESWQLYGIPRFLAVPRLDAIACPSDLAAYHDVALIREPDNRE